MKNYLHSTSLERCRWVTDDPLYIHYHDHEWGVPVYDDQKLFEFLILEGMQAGLSWITILKKRDNYRNLFDHFNAEKIVKYDEKKIITLLDNPGIIRNRLKVQSIIQNASAFLTIKEKIGGFSTYLWQFVDGKPIQHQWKAEERLPSTSSISDHMSKSLKKQGFSFVGSAICYAFMQAVGMINDHAVTCFRHNQLR